MKVVIDGTEYFPREVKSLEEFAEQIINMIKFHYLVGQAVSNGCEMTRAHCGGCAYEKLKPQDAKRHETCLVCKRNYVDHYAVRIVL
jgi:hypothetical protein